MTGVQTKLDKARQVVKEAREELQTEKGEYQELINKLEEVDVALETVLVELDD